MTEWRAVPGWEGFYQVSDDGRLRSLDRRVNHSGGGTALVRGQALQPVYRDGYPEVELQRNGYRRIISVHRIVMWAFVGPQPPELDVCHRDGNPGNPALSNLRYDTPSGNARDRRLHGTDPHVNRVQCPHGHALAAPNLVRYQWVTFGRRQCRACHQTHAYLKTHPELDFQRESDRRYAIIIGTGTPVAHPGDLEVSLLAQVPAPRGTVPGGEPS